jgi:hypothetical protein
MSRVKQMNCLCRVTLAVVTTTEQWYVTVIHQFAATAFEKRVASLHGNDRHCMLGLGSVTPHDW